MIVVWVNIIQECCLILNVLGAHGVLFSQIPSPPQHVPEPAGHFAEVQLPLILRHVLIVFSLKQFCVKLQPLFGSVPEYRLPLIELGHIKAVFDIVDGVRPNIIAVTANIPQ